jgi:hypothetical protein
MGDILRSFRLGVINILGVTVPGPIVLFLICMGFLAPVILLIQDIAKDDAAKIQSGIPEIPPVGNVPPTIGVSAILILAYIIGYIFRLSTPDVLDHISAKRVIKKMGGVAEAKRDHWPHHGEPGNKFPYFHFRDYLKYRKHGELAKYVDWDKHRRSKTSVNKMKLETHIRSPRLSAIIDSNEAHIRLLFGTWLASWLCLPFLALGLAAAAYGMSRCLCPGGCIETEKGQNLLLAYSLWAFLALILMLGSAFAIWRIQSLFHYRRVRELFDVIACMHLAVTGFDSAGQPRKGLQDEELTTGEEASEQTQAADETPVDTGDHSSIENGDRQA